MVDFCKIMYKGLVKTIIQIVVSVILVYFASKRVDLLGIFRSLLKVPPALIIFTLLYSIFSSFFSSWRWGLLILKNPKLKDILFLIKCNYMAMFYSFFIPSSLSADLVRWMPLVKRYNGISKTRLAASVVADRLVGASAFFPLALISAIVGKVFKFNVPDYVVLVSGLGCLCIILLYLFMYYIDLFSRFERIHILGRVIGGIRKFKVQNGSIPLRVFTLSMVVQIVGIFPVWVRSLYLGAGISLVAIYIFMPIISLVLMLPISISGFGVREQLYLFFFTQGGVSDEKVMLVSAFSYLANIMIALIGAAMVIPFPNFFRGLKKQLK